MYEIKIIALSYESCPKAVFIGHSGFLIPTYHKSVVAPCKVIRNPESNHNFNPESWLLVMESGIHGCGFRNPQT